MVSYALKTDSGCHTSWLGKSCLLCLPLTTSGTLRNFKSSGLPSPAPVLLLAAMMKEYAQDLMSLNVLLSRLGMEQNRP